MSFLIVDSSDEPVVQFSKFEVSKGRRAKYNNKLRTPKRLCRAVLYSITLYIEYSKSLLP